LPTLSSLTFTNLLPPFSLYLLPASFLSTSLSISYLPHSSIFISITNNHIYSGHGFHLAKQRAKSFPPNHRCPC
jgi:hypothetical protein